MDIEKFLVVFLPLFADGEEKFSFEKSSRKGKFHRRWVR